MSAAISMRAALAQRRGLLVAGLGALHILIPLVTLAQPNFGHDRHALQSDAHRFQEIATAVGTPGRDFRVEYPPVAVLGMRIIGSDGLAPLMQRIVVLNALADLAIALALWKAWSRRASLVYLALSAPLLAYLLNGFDLAVTALAIVGLACSRRGRQVLGGLLIATAAFVKLWPILLVVVLALWRHRRAVVSAVSALVAGGVAWIAWSGLRGPLDVATFRGARGWHVESTYGAILAVARGAHARYESGSWRVGMPPAALGAAFTIAALLAVCAWFWWSRRLVDVATGTVMVGALTIVLAGATLLSPQFLVWVSPFAAIAAHERRWRVAGAWFAVTVIDALYVATNDLTQPDRMVGHIEVLVRNAALLGVVALCAWELYCVSQARRTSASTSAYATSPLTSTVTECNVPVKALGAA